MWAAVLWLAMLGCESNEAPDPRAHGNLRQRLVSESAPDPGFPMNARFGDYVKLRGYDVSPRPLQPGKEVHLTWHWEVLKPLPAGYQLFTHLTTTSGGRQRNLDGNRALTQVHPPKAWQAGEFIRDPQRFTLPAHWRTSRVRVLAGFYRGDERLPITEGSQAGRRKVELSFAVAKDTSQQPATLRAARRHGEIELDGIFDEAAWQKTEHSSEMVNTLTGGPGAFRAWVRVLYDSEAVYVAFEVKDSDLRSPFRKHDDHLWEQDTVEVMLDPDGDSRNYFEIQVSPRNVVFDTAYASRRQPRPFGIVGWDSHVQAGVRVNGTLDDGPGDEGYSVEMRIPVASLAAEDIAPPEAPHSGGIYRMNFFVMDRRAKGQLAVGLSAPLVGDFHTLGRFARIRFD